MDISTKQSKVDYYPPEGGRKVTMEIGQYCQNFDFGKYYKNGVLSDQKGLIVDINTYFGRNRIGLTYLESYDNEMIPIIDLYVCFDENRINQCEKRKIPVIIWSSSEINLRSYGFLFWDSDI
jgi:hypothetical protein